MIVMIDDHDVNLNGDVNDDGEAEVEIMIMLRIMKMNIFHVFYINIWALMMMI